MTAGITPENVARMSDADLLLQINAHDPYDAEFARRFRALAARLAETEARNEELATIEAEQLSRLVKINARAEAAEADIDTLLACAKDEMEKREVAEAREAKLREALDDLWSWCKNWDAEFMDDPEFDRSKYITALQENKP